MASADSGIGYLFDENLSPKLVSILRLLGERGLHTVVRVYGEGAKDPDWLPLAAEHGYIYVTADRKQLADERVAQVVAEVRGRAVFLPSRYARSPRWEQAQWLLRHWRKIRDETRALARGEMRFVRWNGRIDAAPPGARARTR